MYKLKQKILTKILNLFFLKSGVDVNEEQLKPNRKYLAVFGPHTSHWDMIIGSLLLQRANKDFSKEEEIRMLTPVADYMLKKPWYIFLTEYLFNIGGIPINREDQNQNSKVLRDMFTHYKNKENKTPAIMISPEGTRQPVTEWKEGWYKIAKANKCYIVCCVLDYKTKQHRFEHILDTRKASKEECTRYILDAFRKGSGRNPEWYVDIGEDKTPLESRFDP